MKHPYANPAARLRFLVSETAGAAGAIDAVHAARPRAEGSYVTTAAPPSGRVGSYVTTSAVPSGPVGSYVTTSAPRSGPAGSYVTCQHRTSKV